MLVGSDDDKLYSLNLSDGSVRWTAAPGRCARSVGSSGSVALAN